MGGWDSRQRFRDVLDECSRETNYDDFQSKLWTLSVELTPTTLYRYRSCTPRDLSNLKSELLPFTSPEVFRDDTEDAFIKAEDSDYDRMTELATGLLFPLFDRLSNMSPQQCSEEFCKVFRPFDERDDLFAGMIPEDAENQSASLSESEKKDRIREIVADACSQIARDDTQNALRRQVRVACLCENPDSPAMWDRYADGGRGFQLEYQREDLLGMGRRWMSAPLLFPVIYDSLRPSMSELAMMLALRGFDSWLTTAADPLKISVFAGVLRALYTKDAARFSHEEEWRIIMPDPTINEESRKFAVRMCPCRRIRLGENISDADGEAIRKIAENLSVPVPVLEFGEE